MSMSMKEAMKVTFFKIVPACMIIIGAGLSTYYVLQNYFGLSINANIISMLFVAVGATYIGKVIAGRSK